MRELKQGTYVPFPLRRAYLHESPTKVRPLGIPAVRDRVAQEVIRSLLSPVFERHFHEASHGFRQGHNCHQAVRQVLELCRTGNDVVLDADITGFFDHIRQCVIMDAVAARVADGNILRLVEKFLASGVMEDGVFKPTIRRPADTPQGGVISPLLANIVLNHLDWELDKAGFRFVRYADDFVVLCPTHARVKEARAVVTQVLRDLGLELNSKKTNETTFGKGFTFLGFRLSSRAVTVRAKSVEKFKAKVKALTVRKHNLDADVIVKLNRVIRGTANYFATPFSHCRWQFRNLDAFVRRRLRCMKHKRISQNDNFRVRITHLRRLGLLSLLALCVR